MKRGFTLVEILIVMSVLALILSLVIPFSYTIYVDYTEGLEIDKFILMLSGIRRESFLYNQESIIHEKNGVLYVNDYQLEFKNLKFKVDKPIWFLKNGTSNGGVIYVFTAKNVYKVLINSPYGEILYEKSQRLYFN